MKKKFKLLEVCVIIYLLLGNIVNVYPQNYKSTTYFNPKYMNDTAYVFDYYFIIYPNRSIGVLIEHLSSGYNTFPDTYSEKELRILAQLNSIYSDDNEYTFLNINSYDNYRLNNNQLDSLEAVLLKDFLNGNLQNEMQYVHENYRILDNLEQYKSLVRFYFCRKDELGRIHVWIEFYRKSNLNKIPLDGSIRIVGKKYSEFTIVKYDITDLSNKCK